MIDGPREIWGIRWSYALLASVVGAFVSLILTGLLYTAAMPILFNTQLQSAKVLAVYQTIPPLPLLTTNIGLFLAGWFLVGLVRGLVFARLYPGLPGHGLRKGLGWGLVVWFTMILFAEFYTAVNLLGEPVYLSAFEFALQLPVFLGEGVVEALVYGRAWSSPGP